LLRGSTEPADHSGPFWLSPALGDGLVAGEVGRALPGVVTGAGATGVGRVDVGCGEPAVGDGVAGVVTVADGDECATMAATARPPVARMPVAASPASATLVPDLANGRAR
jgi:hypothetical protein